MTVTVTVTAIVTATVTAQRIEDLECDMEEMISCQVRGAVCATQKLASFTQTVTVKYASRYNMGYRHNKVILRKPLQ